MAPLARGWTGLRAQIRVAPRRRADWTGLLRASGGRLDRGGTSGAWVDRTMSTGPGSTTQAGRLDRGCTSGAWVDWTMGTGPGSTAQAGRLDRATPRRRGLTGCADWTGVAPLERRLAVAGTTGTHTGTGWPHWTLLVHLRLVSSANSG